MLFQNRLKVTLLTSFVGSMSQREGVVRLAIFQHHQILGVKVGHNRAIDLKCQVALWGYLFRKICRGLATIDYFDIKMVDRIPQSEFFFLSFMHACFT